MTLAVYTTIYPAVEPYLLEWYHSLRQQTDQDFDLWIGLDNIPCESVHKMLGSEPNANYVVASSQSTPARIRQEALERIIDRCAAVVLVDSDDLLYPSRVQAARTGLEDSDLSGCALRLIDQQGTDLNLTFGPPPNVRPVDVFPRNNIYGFSNSAYRSDLLRRCLPIPAEAVLVDWWLATRAWLLGARMNFDLVPHMAYRQYSANTARVRFPFAAEQVISDTALVHRHFELLLAAPSPDFKADRQNALAHAAAEVKEFQARIVLHPARLSDYVQALNALRPAPVWWSCVAHPHLDYMWHDRIPVI